MSKKNPELNDLDRCEITYSPRGLTDAFAPSFYCTSYILPVRQDENETIDSMLEVGDYNNE